MAPRRCALAGLIESFEGPWMRPVGSEKLIQVAGLGLGDSVWVDFDSGTSVQTVEITPPTIPFPNLEAKRYRFRKTSGLNPRPTTVEIQL